MQISNCIHCLVRTFSEYSRSVNDQIYINHAYAASPSVDQSFTVLSNDAVASVLWLWWWCRSRTAPVCPPRSPPCLTSSAILEVRMSNTCTLAFCSLAKMNCPEGCHACLGWEKSSSASRPYLVDETRGRGEKKYVRLLRRGRECTSSRMWRDQAEQHRLL
jgi:hypothetical protein